MRNSYSYTSVVSVGSEDLLERLVAMPNTKIVWEISRRSTGTLLILFQRRCHSGAPAAITTWLAPSITQKLTLARTHL
jgi:hypothetical protein